MKNSYEALHIVLTGEWLNARYKEDDKTLLLSLIRPLILIIFFFIQVCHCVIIGKCHILLSLLVANNRSNSD